MEHSRSRILARFTSRRRTRGRIFRLRRDGNTLVIRRRSCCPTENLVGNKLLKSLAMLNPKTLKWTVLPGTGKSDFNAEEGWTLLADGSVLTADVKNAPNSERYVLSAKKWST